MYWCGLHVESVIINGADCMLRVCVCGMGDTFVGMRLLWGKYIEPKVEAWATNISEHWARMNRQLQLHTRTGGGRLTFQGGGRSRRTLWWIWSSQPLTGLPETAWPVWGGTCYMISTFWIGQLFFVWNRKLNWELKVKTVDRGEVTDVNIPSPGAR